MPKTTLSVSEEIRDRLQLYRHPSHDSWSDTLEAMMHALPDEDDMRRGCVICGDQPDGKSPLEADAGVVRWFTIDHPEIVATHGSWFCSEECFEEQIQRQRDHAPDHPDLVVVGGKDNPQAELENATFYLDGNAMQVGVDIPGAFAGTDFEGEEYDYLGEPVFIKNNGKWVHDGVVDAIFHEDGSTTIDMGHDHETVREYHPDPETLPEIEPGEAADEDTPGTDGD